MESPTAPMPDRPDLFLIRHAPVTPAGLLAGRTDLDCALDPKAVAAVTRMLPPVAGVVTSPALRCRRTAAALFPDATPVKDADLWEQDFGIYDGRPYADLPDLGALDGHALAHHRWDGGESFADVVLRVSFRLDHWGNVATDSGPMALVCHAGTIRSALAQVTGPGPALAFEIAPLSVTRMTKVPGGWAIGFVNRVAP